MNIKWAVSGDMKDVVMHLKLNSLDACDYHQLLYKTRVIISPSLITQSLSLVSR